MTDWPRHNITLLFLVSMVLLTNGCAGSPVFPHRSLADEARRAARIVQDRENELAAARAEVAATRIAAAKKEAEFSELRALVTQLRQENGESHQALREAKQVTESRQSELAALKTERDQLFQAKTEQEHDRSYRTALEETVASISQELAQLKQTVSSQTANPVARVPKSNNRKPSDGDPENPSLDQQEPMSSKRAETGEGIVPALLILRDHTNSSAQTRITVQPGDSLWSLARRHRTTVTALRAANGTPGDALIIGQELTLP